MNDSSSSDVTTNARELVMVTFCNQVASPCLSSCVMDLADRSFEWITLDQITGEFRRDLGGMTGLCAVHESVAVCTQSDTTPVLVLLDRTGKVECVSPLRGCRDPHSMVFCRGYVYVVSTGTNEIYRVSLRGGIFGDAEMFWRYPGVKNLQDEVHLNGITVTSEGRLIASCFGEKMADKSWGKSGSVFYIDSGQTIADGLNQPHTPMIVRDHLFFAESGANRVFAYLSRTLDVWELMATIEVPGYARGLAMVDWKLLVGISTSRKVSRSRKVNVSTPTPSTEAAIIQIDLSTLEQRTIVSLGAYTREIYDIMVVHWVREFASGLDALVQRIREMEDNIDRYVVHVTSLTANVTSLAAQLAEARGISEQHEQALRQVYQSMSWRLTRPLRAGTWILRKMRLLRTHRQG